MCYEFTELFLNLFQKKGFSPAESAKQAVGATIFFFFHEAGHMLISELKLPATGKEEDVVDQFSTILLSKIPGDSGETYILAAANFFKFISTPSLSRSSFIDEHGLDLQRFYNTLCFLYGDNPKKYGSILKGQGYSDVRLCKCQQEYAQQSTAWKTLLAPHLRKKEF